MKNLALTALGILLAGGIQAQSFSGQVFNDVNRNGVLDAGEKGISGISVSDGLHVVKTGEDGRYSLPGHARQKFVFITPAHGYNFVKNYFIKIDSTVQSYDFPMYAAAVATHHNKDISRFIRITDTETYQYGDWINETRNYAKNEEADFVVHTGDICYEKGLQFHAQQVNTKTMGLPVYYCVGNHDLVKGPTGEALFESLFGPVFYSFEYGNTHFVVTPMPYGDYQPSYTYDDLYYWLKSDLANTDPQKSIVIFNHDLLTYSDHFAIKNSKGDSLVLNDHNLKAWIYGHWHINFARKHGNTGIRSICSAPAADGGIDNSMSNFDVIEVAKEGIVSVNRRYTYIANQLVLVSPTKYGAAVKNQQLTVSANVYQTDDPVKSVVFRLYDNNGKLLQQSQLKAASDWTWNGALKTTGLQPQTLYNSTLEATLNTGRVLFRRDTFRINPATAPAGNNNWDQVLQNTQRLPNIAINKVKPRLVWTSNTGANIWKSSPIIVNGKLYLATIDDENNTKSAIIAMEATSGKILWKFPTGNSIKHSLSYTNGKILGTDAEGMTYALDANTGKLLWQHDGGMRHLATYNSAGVVYKNTYITGAGNYMQALDINTGNPLWTNTAWSGGEGTPAAMTIFGNAVITSSNWNALFAHDLNTGKLLWKRSDGGIRFRSGTAVNYDNKLYVHGINMLHMLNESGATVDSIPLKYNLKTMTAPAIAGNKVLLCTAEDGLVIFDKQSKQELGVFKPKQSLTFSAPYTLPPAAGIESTPLVAGNIAYVAASDGHLYVLNISGKPEVIQDIDLGAPVLADMTLVNGMLYVADFSGNVNAFVLE
ncbi:MAG: PQQ-binding-like beta-propeller repeat protein [Chitinophaga sp.]|uniref:outer membrane protein assembly factor BamB family protein n=1 Tax=Chitinophaga sp. TaxID=1869181 RepID=UPI0025BC7B7B|nr:PQQ-binding-like beta-propeller repeat protein [Chitinophaga sp.]MBV8253979.1 PQQ-binding-like beta-propeller repeat protein [Chitinophaga sp.]